MITDSEFESIIKEFAEGPSLTDILKRRKISMFDFSIFRDSTPDRSNRFDTARRAKADVIVEELIGISDTEMNPQVARIRTDVRKWYASKAAPQQYGDRIDINLNQVVDISGALAAANARVVHQSVSIPDTKKTLGFPPRDMSPEDGRETLE